MPKIREIILNLEGFQYAMSLDLNMGYYRIRLSKEASNLCTIILPWVTLELPDWIFYQSDIHNVDFRRWE